MRIGFTDRELDIMTVLWDAGPSTAAEVRAILGVDLAYNTVLTMLRILEEKGYVDHIAEGRSHRYRALVGRAAAGASAAARLVDRLFDGSAEHLIAHLVRERGLEPGERERLLALLKRRVRRARP